MRCPSGDGFRVETLADLVVAEALWRQRQENDASRHRL